MMAHKWRKELWESKIRLEEIHIFLEEDLQNTPLQEEVVNRVLDLRRMDDLLAKVLQRSKVCSDVIFKIIFLLVL